MKEIKIILILLQDSEIDNFIIYENYYNSKNSKVEISQEEESLIPDNFSNEEDVDKNLLENNFENTGFFINDIFFDDERRNSIRKNFHFANLNDINNKKNRQNLNRNKQQFETQDSKKISINNNNNKFNNSNNYHSNKDLYWKSQLKPKIFSFLNRQETIQEKEKQKRESIVQQFAFNMKVNIKQKKNNFNHNNFMKQIKQKNVNADKGNDSKSY